MLKFRKKNLKTVQKRAPNFYFAGIKAKLDEGGGRILLGDNSSAGVVFLRPIMFHFAGVST
jgi:hypothetical protein